MEFEFGWSETPLGFLVWSYRSWARQIWKKGLSPKARKAWREKGQPSVQWPRSREQNILECMTREQMLAAKDALPEDAWMLEEERAA